MASSTIDKIMPYTQPPGSNSMCNESMYYQTLCGFGRIWITCVSLRRLIFQARVRIRSVPLSSIFLLSTCYIAHVKISQQTGAANNSYLKGVYGECSTSGILQGCGMGRRGAQSLEQMTVSGNTRSAQALTPARRISESPAGQIMETVLGNDGNLPDMQWDFDLKQVWNWLTDTALGVSVMGRHNQNVWHVPRYPRQKDIWDTYLSLFFAGGRVHLVVAAAATHWP